MRRTIWTIAVMAGCILLAVVALPFVASTRLVSDRIAESMSEWTGLDVAIGSVPEIDIWPDLQANLTDVTLSLPGGGAVLIAARVEVELSALATIGGDIDFSMARFIRPTVHLPEDAMLPALPGNGRMARSIFAARQIVSEDRSAPDMKRLPDDDFGVVEFIDGRIVRKSGGSEEEVASGLSGKIDWETLSGRASFAARGVMQGEQFTFGVTSANPLLLLGGATSHLTFSLKSAPLDASFDGTANLGENPYAEGRGSMSAPEFQKLFEWSDTEIPRDLGAVSLEGRVLGDLSRIRLEEAAITLGGTPARGALDLLLTGRLPKLSGTLAFDTLDLGTFLSAFTPLDTSPGPDAGTLDADFASRINLDLRLSAKRATAGAIALADLAATARVDAGLAAFDISDASAFGGSIQAGLRFDRKGSGVQVEMRLLASEIDGGAFGTATSFAQLIPQAQGNMSVILKSEGEDWQGLLARANGSVSANFGPGTLQGIDLGGLVSKAATGVPFPLEEVSAGASPIAAMDMKAVMTNGTAAIEKTVITTPLHRITLNGSADLAEGMLNLIAQAEPPPQAEAGAAGPPAVTTFRVEGPADAAIVMPMETAVVQ